MNYSSGAIVLGDKSSQIFGTATYMCEDTRNSVTKRVRLIVNNKKYEQKYVPLASANRDDSFPPRISVS